MPKETITEKRSYDLGEVWGKKIASANKLYDIWARKYRVEALEEAYYGHQWDEDEKHSGLTDDRYVFNMIMSSIDVKTPSLLFQYPVYEISPRPAKTSFDPESAFLRAQLRSDVLNYFAKHDIVDLAETSEAGILDAFFRFGIIEVGFSADWIDNPNAGRPILKEDQEPYVDDEGNVIKQPKRIPQNERIYTKQIPANRFRVSVVNARKLSQCDWVGYWEWARKSDLKASDSLQNKDQLPTYGRVADVSLDYFNEEALGDEKDEMLRAGDLCKIWKIFDLRSNKRYILSEPNFTVHDEEPFKRLPLFALKFRNRLTGFYPLPPVFNWISPQREINDVRESARIHRKRFNRIYIANRTMFEDGELDKLETGGDGTVLETNGDTRTAASLLETGGQNPSHGEMLQVSQNDFNTISATTAEARGEPQGDVTATQAKITDTRSQIRESRDKVIVAKWLSAIGKEILLQAKERLSQDFWVKIEKSSEDDFAEMQQIEDTWLLINSEEFGDEDFDVSINIVSMSPVDNEIEKAKFIEFISVLHQFPQLSLSPVMIRECADRIGYRNQKAIAILQKLSQLQLAGLLEQLGASATGGNTMAQKNVAQATPNTTEQIRNQLANQSIQ